MRLFFLTLFTGLCFTGQAATIMWDGDGGDGLWSTASNWSTDMVPGAADDVLLNNSVVPGGYVVVLPDYSVTIRTLTIAPDNSGIFITLSLPATNSVSTGAFITLGTGSGYSVTINAGGAFENHGNVSSGTNLTIADSIRINDGGNYIHITKSDVSGWINKLSRMPGTEDGTFTFAVPAATYTADLGGVSFGTLILGTATLGSPVIYTISGSSQLSVRGGFNINTDVTANFGMLADIIVKKTFYLLTGGTLNLQTSTFNNVFSCKEAFFSFGTLTKTGSGIPQILLNGTSIQNVIVAGSFTNSIEFNVNNPAGITLGSPVTLPYKLILTNGKIRTTVANILILADDATCSGGAASSFVEGPMKKIGDDNFTFPVGYGGMYAPIGIINVTGESVTDTFTAEYKRTNPQSTGPYGSLTDPTLDHVSYVEYWNLDRNNGTASKMISLAVNLTSFCRDMSRTYVSRWDGTKWTNEGSVSSGVTPVGSYETGTLTSVNPISTFTAPNAFTLSSDLPFNNNPLPIQLISFDAVKVSNTKSMIRWALAECCSSTSKFEIQRAGERKIFFTIGTTPGKETDRFYDFLDDELQSGINYYRLKMTDETEKITYSKIVAVLNGTNGLLLTSLIPSVIDNTGSLTITSSKTMVFDLVITDMQGKILKRQQSRANAGNSTFVLSFSGLAAGIYHLTAITNEGKSNTIRFLKQ